MQADDPFLGQMTDLVMAAIRDSGVMKEDQPNHPHNYNRGWSAVYDKLKEKEREERENPTIVAQPPENSGVRLPPGLDKIGSGQKQFAMGSIVGTALGQKEDPRAALAKALGKTIIPDGWPKLARFDQVLVVGPKNLMYMFQVWELRGKQVVMRCTGAVEE